MCMLSGSEHGSGLLYVVNRVAARLVMSVDAEPVLCPAARRSPHESFARHTHAGHSGFLGLGAPGVVFSEQTDVCVVPYLTGANASREVYGAVQVRAGPPRLLPTPPPSS